VLFIINLQTKKKKVGFPCSGSLKHKRFIQGTQNQYTDHPKAAKKNQWFIVTLSLENLTEQINLIIYLFVFLFFLNKTLFSKWMNCHFVIFSEWLIQKFEAAMNLYVHVASNAFSLCFTLTIHSIGNRSAFSDMKLPPVSSQQKRLDQSTVNSIHQQVTDFNQ